MASNILTVPGTIKAQTGNNNLGIDVSNDLDISYTTLGPVSTPGTVQYKAVLENDWITSTVFTAGGNGGSIEWSPELEIFSAVPANTTEVFISSDGLNWTSGTAVGGSTTSAIRNIWIPELMIFFSVCSTRWMYSSDGLNWTVYVGEFLATQVEWSPELGIIVVMNPSGLAISSNAINWTTYSTATTATYGPIVWSPELGIFCNIKNGTTSQISSDGINWNSQSSGLGDSGHFSITWSSEFGVFATQSYPGTTVYYSSDGLNWTTSVSVTTAWDIIWIQELKLFALMGNFDSFYFSGNLTDWTSKTTVGGYNLMTWSPKLGIIASYASSATISRAIVSNPDYSTINKNTIIGTRGAGGPDGNTVDIQGNTLKIGEGSNSVSVGKYGRTVTVGSSQSTELRITGNIRTGAEYLEDVLEASGLPNNIINNIPSINSEAIDYSPKLNIIVVNSRGSVYYSIDNGITYSLTNANLSGDIGGIAWSPSLEIFCAVTLSTTLKSTSEDGINWLSYDSGFASRYLAWSPQLGIFSTTNGTTVGVSSDGLNWTTYNAGVSVSHIKWFPDLGYFVGATTNGIVRSSDGINWNVQGTTDKARYSTYSPELGVLLVTYGQNSSLNILYIKDDGSQFTVNTGTSAQKGDVDWSPQLGVFLAGGNNSFVYSKDGINWKVISNGNDNRRIKWIPELGKFIITGFRRLDSTVPNYSYQENTGNFPTKTITLGTRGVNDNKVSIEGQEIEVGKASNKVTIGEYANVINIGNPGSNITYNGGFNAIAILKEITTIGGTSTLSWTRRNLNTLQTSGPINVSLSGGQFSLETGIYYIKAMAPAFRSNNHIIRLTDVEPLTDIVLIYGSNEWNTNTANFCQTYSFLEGLFSIQSTQVLELQHRVENNFSSTGFGRGVSGLTSSGITAAPYAQVIIFKMS